MDPKLLESLVDSVIHVLDSLLGHDGSFVSLFASMKNVSTLATIIGPESVVQQMKEMLAEISKKY